MKIQCPRFRYKDLSSVLDEGQTRATDLYIYTSYIWACHKPLPHATHRRRNRQDLLGPCKPQTTDKDITIVYLLLLQGYCLPPTIAPQLALVWGWNDLPSCCSILVILLLLREATTCVSQIWRYKFIQLYNVYIMMRTGGTIYLEAKRGLWLQSTLPLLLVMNLVLSTYYTPFRICPATRWNYRCCCQLCR